MSQTPPFVCVACNTVVEPGTRFCPNCGTGIPSAAPIAPTIMSASSEQPLVPTIMATPSGVQNEQMQTPPVGYRSSPSHPDLPQYGGTPVQPNAHAHTQYNTPPPPPSAYASTPHSAPSDPYGTPPPNDPYGSGVNYAPGSFPNYSPSVVPPPAPAKKRSALPVIIISIVVVLLAACVGGTYLVVKTGQDAVRSVATQTPYSGNSSGSTGSTSSGSSTDNTKHSSSANLNLSFTYSSVLITVTKLEQAHKFADDSLTTYSYQDNANYIRISFSEQQNAKDSSYFTYQSSVHLILPDKNTVTAEGEEQDSGPDHSVSRTNWMDFPITGTVDLSKLTLQVGGGDEAQMSIPLQNNTDLSAYKDKTITPNKTFSYAGMDWTLKDATQSLSDDGKQAKTGQVYVVVDLIANNSSQSTVYLSGSNFARLKADGTSIAPDYSSSADQFYSIDSNTSNVTGTLVFLTKPSSSGTYTLDFQAGDNIQEQTVDFSFS